MIERVIFQATNHHTPDCGIPPRIDATDSPQYRGYFENAQGEQAIFVYDRPARRGTLYLGDAGWETPHRVRDGVATDLVLSGPERQWLLACWEAATGGE